MARSAKHRQRKLQQKAKKRRAKRRRRSASAPAIVTSPGPLKMSEVISHLAEPLVDEFGDSPEDLEQIITLTITAWNLTLFPVEIQEKEFTKLAKKTFGGDREAISFLRWICDTIAERKERFYPHLKHFIVDVHFTREEDDSVYFEVAYGIG
jgi:hypothetical protein